MLPPVHVYPAHSGCFPHARCCRNTAGLIPIQWANMQKNALPAGKLPDTAGCNATRYKCGAVQFPASAHFYGAAHAPVSSPRRLPPPCMCTPHIAAASPLHGAAETRRGLPPMHVHPAHGGCHPHACPVPHAGCRQSNVRTATTLQAVLRLGVLP